MARRCAAIETLRSIADGPLQLGRIGDGLLPCGAEIDREERRRGIQQLEPAGIDLRRQVMALRIVLVGTELGVVIEVPARELAGRDPAWRGIEKAEDPRRQRPRSLEHVVVQDLVQQDREVEDRKALDEGQRNPDERVVEGDESPGRRRKDRKLASSDREMTRRGLAMERAQRFARNRLAELSLQFHRVLRVVVGHHPQFSR